MNNSQMNEAIRAAARGMTVIAKPKDPVGDAMRQALGKGTPRPAEQPTEPAQQPETPRRIAKGNAGAGTGAIPQVGESENAKMNKWLRRGKLSKTIVEQEITR